MDRRSNDGYQPHTRQFRRNELSGVSEWWRPGDSWNRADQRRLNRALELIFEGKKLGRRMRRWVTDARPKLTVAIS